MSSGVIKAPKHELYVTQHVVNDGEFRFETDMGGETLGTEIQPALLCERWVRK